MLSNKTQDKKRNSLTTQPIDMNSPKLPPTPLRMGTSVHYLNENKDTSNKIECDSKSVHSTIFPKRSVFVESKRPLSKSKLKLNLENSQFSVFKPHSRSFSENEKNFSDKSIDVTKRGKWSSKEQNQCFNFFLNLLGDWKGISEKLEKRNLNSIKNLFYSSIRSIKKSFTGNFFKKLINCSCKSIYKRLLIY